MRRRLFVPEADASRRRRRRRGWVGGVSALEARRLLAIITVNSAADVSNDPSVVTLRSAIEQANGTPETDTIVFAIAGPGVHAIQPASPLPTITTPVFIDGESQGTSATPLIEIDGSLISTPETAGLVLGTSAGGSASTSTIRGLNIHGFTGAGILINGASGIAIQGNFLGTDPTGTVATPNGVGLAIVNGSSNTIGGLTDNQGNLISGNTGDGVQIQGASAKDNVVQGNRIGVKVGGTTALGNGGVGVLIASDGTPDGGARDNTIGGTLVSARNIISGNVGAGVLIRDASTASNSVEGNFIGLSLDGDSAVPNAVGVEVRDGAHDNTIGGFTIPTRNVISGNAEAGVRIIDAGNNIVAGNYIGTKADASAALPGDQQSLAGILIQNNAQGNTIGGLTATAANLISGNSGAGLWIQGPGGGGDAPRQNLVEGNRIGTNADGNAAIPNTGPGVVISGGASNNTIGASSEAGRNIISGNGGDGVLLGGFDTKNNQVLGNLIGLAVDGTSDLGNQGNGIRIDGGSSSAIGGSTPGAGNSIAFNQGAGVLVSAGVNNAIHQNAIFSNTGLGIELDTGANLDQAFPVLTQAIAAGTASRISGTLESRPSTSFTIEFYSSPENRRQGKTFVGAVTVTTGTDGKGTFSYTPTTALTGGQFLTATATDPAGNTSEFSEPIGITAPQSDLSVSQSISTPTSAPANTAIAGGFLTYTILITNHGPDPAESVSLVDTLPTGADFIGATASQGGIVLGTGTVTVNLGRLGNQETATVTITVVAPTPAPTTGTISNVATASLPEGLPDTDSSNNTSTLVSEIMVGIDLGLDQSATPIPAVVGQDVAILLTITNNNETPATGVVLTNVLPENFEVVSVDATSPFTSHREGGNLVIEFNGSLPPSGSTGTGFSARVTIVGRPTTTGTLFNAAIVRADQGQTVLGHNSGYVPIQVVDALPPVSTGSVAGTALRVTDVSRIGRGHQPTRLVVAFDQALESASAEALANYRLVAAGRDGRFGTRDDLPIRLRAASYDPTNDTVTLTTTRPLRPALPVRLAVSGGSTSGVVGTHGARLDGDFVSVIQSARAVNARALASRLPGVQAGRFHPRGWRS